jgi:hypothetical protein
VNYDFLVIKRAVSGKKTYQTYLDGEFGDFPFLLNGMSLENHLRIMENGDIIIGMGMGWE